MNLKGIIIPDYIKYEDNIYKLDKDTLCYKNPLLGGMRIAVASFSSKIITSVILDTQCDYSSSNEEEYNEQNKKIKQLKIEYNEQEIDNLEKRINELKKEIDELKE